MLVGVQFGFKLACWLEGRVGMAYNCRGRLYTSWINAGQSSMSRFFRHDQPPKMLSVLIIFSLLLSEAWLVYTWYCLLLNYLQPRKIGVLIRVIPISHENPFWMVVDKKFLRLFYWLPFGSGSFTGYNWRGWEFAVKCSSHLKMGDVFMLVTPGRNWLYSCGN